MLSRFAYPLSVSARRLLQTSTCKMALSAAEEQRMFFEKNRTLKRPTSPHMLIYAWPITSLTSGTHRLTGAVMSLAIYAIGGSLFLATGHSDAVINYIRELSINPTLMLTLKALFVWPLCYHAVSGLRHLIWDVGVGFELSVLPTAAAIIILSSFALAFYVASLKPKNAESVTPSPSK